MDLSLFEHDAGYYEFVPGKWLPGKPPPGGFRNWGPDVVAKAVAVEFEDSDVLIATYPKTGQCAHRMCASSGCPMRTRVQSSGETAVSECSAW